MQFFRRELVKEKTGENYILKKSVIRIFTKGWEGDWIENGERVVHVERTEELRNDHNISVEKYSKETIWETWE